MILQLADVPADGRFGEIQHPSSCRKPFVFHNGSEKSDVVQVLHRTASVALFYKWNNKFLFPGFWVLPGAHRFASSFQRETTMKLLHIDSGILGTASVSRQLSSAVVAQYRANQTGLEVVSRDLVAAPLSHLNGEQIFAAGAD